jgi:FkbM family methyltransferase
MQTKLIRFVYDQRSWLKRFIFIRRPVLLRLRDFMMYVRLDDWDVGARIAVKRTYERHVTESMRPLLKPGMVMIDIGANIGYYSLLAASRVGATGKVTAFEPSMENCALLQKSVKANGFDNVVIHSMAVTDLEGTVGFSMGDSNGSIDRKNPDSRPIQVRAVRLDGFLKDEPRIDLIKMDIEGAEGFALAGMRHLLARYRPILFTEFCPSALQAISEIMPEDYLSDLRELGYELHIVHRGRARNGGPQSNEEIMREFAECQSDHLDIAAYPRDRSVASC